MGAASSKGGYPPCDPGPGDDNCIQLYEAGVDSSTNLAMNRNLGEGSTMMASADTTSGATPSTWTNDSSPTADMTSTAVGRPHVPVAGAPTTNGGHPPLAGPQRSDKFPQLHTPPPADGTEGVRDRKG